MPVLFCAKQYVYLQQTVNLCSIAITEGEFASNPVR